MRLLCVPACALAAATSGVWAVSDPPVVVTANTTAASAVASVTETVPEGSVSPALPLPHYTAGSIDSVTVADRALAEAKAAQLEQEKIYVARRQACYTLLVAEPCLRRAIEDNARAERRIRAVEVDARAFKRHQTEREAAAARSAKRARDAQADARKQTEAAGSSNAQQQHLARNAAAQREFEAGAALRERRAARERKRLESRQAARIKKEAELRVSAAERGERARAHEVKVREVLQRAAEKEARARDNAARTAPKGAAAEVSPAPSSPATPSAPSPLLAPLPPVRAGAAADAVKS